MRFEIGPDGRVTLEAAQKSELSFLPGFDGLPFSYSGGGRYAAREGGISLSAESLGEYHAALSMGFTAADAAPVAVQPVCGGLIDGLAGAFRQGLGLGGPSGYVAADELPQTQPFTSYGLLALRLRDGALVLFTDDTTRCTLQFHVSPAQLRPGCWQVSASFMCEGAVNRDECLTLHALFDASLEVGLRRAAEYIASRANAVPREAAYHWCSWYYYYNNFDAKQLRELLDGMAGLDHAPPIRYVQIDAGYFPSAGDWLEADSHFTEGLRKTFADIKRAGFQPGIWIAPFMAGCRSRLFTEHPDWMLRKRDGGYVTPWKMYNEPKVWGYQDEEYYVLDTSHPGALAYIVSVFAQMRAWGAEMFKTDFMLWGIQPSNEVVRHTPGKTSVVYYREFMEKIREAIGDAYWLGCIAPFLPMLGFANGMRIAGDVGAEWAESGFGPSNLLQEITADSYFNGVYWQNDPDAVLLRERFIFLNDREVESLALLQAVSGGAVYTSETIHLLPERRLALFRFIQPDAVHRPGVPFLDKREKAIALTQTLGERRLIYLLNRSAEPLDVCYPIRDLTGDDTLYLREYHQPDCETHRNGQIAGRIQPHGCMLWFGDTRRPITVQPDNLWVWGEYSHPT